MKTNRTEAIKWWANIDIATKNAAMCLTGREIENFWEKCNEEKLSWYCDLSYAEQVKLANDYFTTDGPLQNWQVVELYNDLMLGKAAPEKIEDKTIEVLDEMDKMFSEVCQSYKNLSKKHRALLEKVKEMVLWSKTKNGKFTFETSDKWADELINLIK